MSSNHFVFKNMAVDLLVSKERVKEGVVIAKQPHRDVVGVIETGNEELDAYDALVTENKNIKIGVFTADCAPITYADGEKIGVAHVGWKGLCLGLAQKMLPYFSQDKLEVFVGPHLYIFEIQKDECYDQLEKVFSNKFFLEKDGKIFFQYKEALASCLPPQTIFDDRMTGLSSGLPSHRLNKTTERLITVVQFI